MFRYISFNPRVVQRMSPSQILRGESYFTLFGSLPGPVSAEILRLREDATSHKIELKRRIRADFTTTTMCRKYSAILHFSPSPDFKSDLTSKARVEPALICIKTAINGFETYSKNGIFNPVRM